MNTKNRKQYVFLKTNLCSLISFWIFSFECLGQLAAFYSVIVLGKIMNSKSKNGHKTIHNKSMNQAL